MPKSKRKEKDSFDPANMKPEEVLKFEIASELGLADKVINGGWRSLTAKESGRIGGLITKRKKRTEKRSAADGRVLRKRTDLQWFMPLRGADPAREAH